MKFWPGRVNLGWGGGGGGGGRVTDVVHFLYSSSKTPISWDRNETILYVLSNALDGICKQLPVYINMTMTMLV